jgi:hypothetical protein
MQGRYFAILNGITFGNVLFGAVITTFCFGLVSDETYFIVLTVMGFCSLVFCHFFIADIDVPDNIAAPHDWCRELKKAFSYYRKMSAIIPFLIFDGLVLGFISTSSTKLMPHSSTRV